MRDDVIRTALTVAGVLVSLCALTWSVASWRLAGPSLRFHCFWYRDVLVIRVFNAGRTADSVEQMDLGTRPREPLTKLLELPLRVESGQAKEWRVGADRLSVKRKLALSGGWAPLWTLTGSMRQRRHDIVPVAQSEPSESGWQLVPRRARWWRFAPLGTCLFSSLTLEPGWADLVAAIAFTLLFLWGLFRAFGLKTAKYPRARVQRRVTAASLTLAVVGGSVTAQMAEPPLWHVVSQAVLTVFAGGLAYARADEALWATGRWIRECFGAGGLIQGRVSRAWASRSNSSG